MPIPQELDPTLIGGLTAAFSALTLTVGVLWTDLKRRQRRLERQHDECEEDNKELWRHVVELYRCAVESAPPSYERIKSLMDSRKRRKTGEREIKH